MQKTLPDEKRQGLSELGVFAVTKKTIITERLLLRPFAFNDLDSTHEYASDIENTRYMIWLPNKDRHETMQFLQRAIAELEMNTPRFYEFAIIYQGKHIGAVSVSLDESGKEGEIGWIIHKDFQNRGFATEAAKAIMDFSVTQLHIRKIVAHCDFRNTASRKVMEKIGLTLESSHGVRLYRDNRDNNQAVNEYMYSLLLQ